MSTIHVTFDDVESRLALPIPDALRRAVGEFAGIGIPSEMYPLSAKELLIQNFEQRRIMSEALSGHLIIGTDGGECIFLLAKDDPESLLQWNHETQAIEPTGDTLSEYLREMLAYARQQREAGEQVDVCRPKSKTYILHQTANWFESSLEPIDLNAWNEIVERDPQLSSTGVIKRIDPFSGQVLQFSCPGAAILTLQSKVGTRASRQTTIEFTCGRLIVESRAPALESTIREWAEKLGCRLTLPEEN